MAGLHAFQSACVSDMHAAVRAGARKVLLVAPTGAGKTRIVSSFFKSIDGPIIAAAHRVEIVRQIEKEFSKSGVRSLIGTIGSSKVRSAVNDPEYRALFFDEAHHVPASSWRQIFDAANKAGKLVVGATATPFRHDRVAVSKLFDAVIEAPAEAELRAAGHLASITYVKSEGIDFSDIKRKANGDFDQAAALARVRVVVQAGDVGGSWLRYAPGRKALIYAVNIEHAEMLVEELARSGHNAPLLTSRTGKKARESLIADFNEDRVDGIVNVETLTEGTDLQGVGAIIMVRPTNSRALFKQMVGRGARRDCDCVVIDHVGNYERHSATFTSRDEDALARCVLTVPLSAQSSDTMGVEILKIVRVEATMSSRLVNPVLQGFFQGGGS